MSISKNNELKWGTILSYVQMGLSVIIGLIYTPFMIRLLGKSEYGLYNTIVSTISMLSILSLGFNSSYIRYYSIYKINKEKDSIYKLNGLFLIVFLVIGFISLLCGLYLSFNLNIVFNQGLNPAEYQIAKILMILLTINLTISFPMSVFVNIISAHEKFVFLKMVGMLKTVISPLVTLPILLCGYKSIAIVIVTLAISTISDIIYLFYVFKSLKQKFIFHDFDKGLFKQIFIFTAFIAINIIVDQINLNIDKILLGRFKGTESVAVYSVGFTLYSYYMMFSTSVSSVFTPRIHNIINNTQNDKLKQNNELTNLFIKVGRIQFIILMLILTGFIFFGQYFIDNIWAGEGYSDSYFVALLLLVPATIPLIQNLGIEIQRAEYLHKFRSISYAIMAIVNFIISLFLCQKYGAIGSAIGTAISFLLANGLIMNIYYHKKCNINIISFWKSILSLSKGVILPVIFGTIIYLFIDISSIWMFLLLVVSYTLIYLISLVLFGLNEKEKKFILKPMMKIIKTRGVK